MVEITDDKKWMSRFVYYGDGKRVWAKDYEGYPTGELKRPFISVATMNL